ncbi:MAG: pro-sigmaK processing inhibitor BofA family protein [Oscillospiraceae bacterium]|nr:pro-sigmaK processing inhibitor BofA family protein [Oscillospiraceae bacterium]
MKYFVIIASIAIIIFYCLRAKPKSVSLLFMSVPGLLALAFLNSISDLTGLYISYSPFNVVMCTFFGLPGVITASVFNIINV